LPPASIRRTDGAEGELASRLARAQPAVPPVVTRNPLVDTLHGAAGLGIGSGSHASYNNVFKCGHNEEEYRNSLCCSLCNMNTYPALTRIMPIYTRPFVCP
jgi:hypothetical protein